jgi:hypothetical protein
MKKEQGLIKYRYIFNFDNGTSKEFNLKLDSETLNLVFDKKEDYPEWMELSKFKCPNCRLDEEKTRYCPVVTNLVDVISAFKDSLSYEKAIITVETEERKYIKDTDLQKGLNSLVGIYMVTSGCP